MGPPQGRHRGRQPEPRRGARRSRPRSLRPGGTRGDVVLPRRPHPPDRPPAVRPRPRRAGTTRLRRRGTAVPRGRHHRAQPLLRSRGAAGTRPVVSGHAVRPHHPHGDRRTRPSGGPSGPGGGVRGHRTPHDRRRRHGPGHRSGAGERGPSARRHQSGRPPPQGRLDHPRSALRRAAAPALGRGAAPQRAVRRPRRRPAAGRPPRRAHGPPTPRGGPRRPAHRPWCRPPDLGANTGKAGGHLRLRTSRSNRSPTTGTRSWPTCGRPT